MAVSYPPHLFINKLFDTTETDENAIASPAIIGLSKNPKKG